MKPPPLKPYQLECLDEIDSFNGRAHLGLDLGLGKTAIVISWLKKRRKALPAVIVCPAFLKNQWSEEAKLFGDFYSDILDGTYPAERNGHISPITIVNPNILGQMRGEHVGPGQLSYLLSIKPKTVVVDESQQFGSRTSKRTKWLQQLCHEVPYVISLSATPASSRPAELFPILNILRPDKWNSFPHFARRHCDPRVEYGRIVYKGATHIRTLRKRMLRHVLIRRRKADVLAELPPLTREVVPLPISDRDRYAKAKDHFLAWLSKEHPTKVRRAFRLERLVRWGYLLRLTAKLKKQAVYSWIDNFLSSSGKDKICLFTMHRKMVARLKRRYPNSVVIDGSVSMPNRRLAVRKFQSDPKCRTVLVNVKAGGFGLDGLQKVCSDGAFCELPWTPGDVSQVIGRLDRLGQTKPVNFRFLVAAETIEVALCSLLKKKSRILTSILDGESTTADLDGVFDILERELRK